MEPDGVQYPPVPEPGKMEPDGVQCPATPLGASNIVFMGVIVAPHLIQGDSKISSFRLLIFRFLIFNLNFRFLVFRFYFYFVFVISNF